MTRAQIVGWAHSVFGKAEAEDVEGLMASVVPQALTHAGVPARAIDGIFVGVFDGGFSQQNFHGALVGMAVPELAQVPSVRLESACATGRTVRRRQGCHPRIWSTEKAWDRCCAG